VRNAASRPKAGASARLGHEHLPRLRPPPHVRARLSGGARPRREPLEGVLGLREAAAGERQARRCHLARLALLRYLCSSPGGGRSMAVQKSDKTKHARPFCMHENAHRRKG